LLFGNKSNGRLIYIIEAICYDMDILISGWQCEGGGSIWSVRKLVKVVGGTLMKISLGMGQKIAIWMEV